VVVVEVTLALEKIYGVAAPPAIEPAPQGAEVIDVEAKRLGGQP